MRDPFPVPPPEWLVQKVKPYADAVALYSLPIHAHEVIFAALMYTLLFAVVSPAVSRIIIPARYKAFNRRTRVNWDVHMVSFFQSVLICIFSLWVIFVDEERKEWRKGDAWQERIWAYSGLSGLLQSFALGYFLWDLFMCTYHIQIFGVGMLAHAISAVTVFAFGYRPFVYFYCPVFLLYELSSPFLNIHWFCDKLDLTGSVYQAVNGIFLTTTFFGCRIIWGLYSSFNVFYDIYRAINAGHSQKPALPAVGLKDPSSRSGDVSIWWDESGQKNAFVGQEYLPLWLAAAYLASNIVLNTLNIFWFGKMVETIRRRFEPPFGTKGVGPEPRHWDAAERLAKKEAASKAAGKVPVVIERGIAENGNQTMGISSTTRRTTRRKA